MIEIKNLNFSYDQDVLKNISFKEASNIVILGVNGVGKSTLAKCLCNLLDFRGAVLLDGVDIKKFEAKELAKTITYIPPRLESFDQNISCLDFVLMGRYPYKDPFSQYSKDDIKLCKKLLDEISLEYDKALGSLSSGQEQLLLIAQALSLDANKIIFDEPTSNLDPSHSLELFKSLKNLDKSKQKIVITHDLHFAKALGYKVFFLSKDALEIYDDADDFFKSENLSKAYGTVFKDGSIFYD